MKDRITPCKYYECKGQCAKNREADHYGYCQRCDKYVPRVRMKYKNMKKDKIHKTKSDIRDYE